MQPISSLNLLNEKINKMVEAFENQPENTTLEQMQQLIQEYIWKDSNEVKYLDKLKTHLIKARVDSNNNLIKKIEEISSFLKAGPLAQLPKDILLKILTTTDLQTIKSQAHTNSFFNQLLKDSQFFLPILNQIDDVEKRFELAKHLGLLVKVLDLKGYKNLNRERLQSLAHACPNIRVLSLEECMIKEEELNILTNFYKLESLNLAWSNITGLEIANIAKSLTQLQSLYLANLHFIKDEDLRIIAESLPQIQLLDLSYCSKVTDEGLRIIAESLPKLRSIDLTFCSKVTDGGIEAITKSLTQLQYLNLSFCLNITDKGVKAIAQSLMQLQSLNLTFCSKVTDEGIEAIAKSLMQLQSLNLSFCSKVTDKGVETIGKSLTQLQSFKLLPFSIGSKKI